MNTQFENEELDLRRDVITNKPKREISDANSRTKNDTEIIFSKSIRAGKRIYYLDAKRNKYGDMYLSITESKRHSNPHDLSHPSFEKHKIFVFEDDFDNFMEALDMLTTYIRRTSKKRREDDFWKQLDLEE